MQCLFQHEPEALRRRIPVRLVNSSGAAQLGLSFSAGDLKLSKNGTAEANHSGTMTEVAGGLYFYEAALAEVDTLGFLSLRVVKAGALDFIAVVAVSEDTVRGSVVTDAGNTSGSFKTDLASAETDAYKDLLILFLDGPNRDQVKKCAGYNGTTKVLSTTAAFTDAPAAGDKFRVLNR
jgi:hypothetical protein